MPSVLPGYEYDIFISYRQKDNKYDGWVTEFVDHLKTELEATFKEEISVYFDVNPHDGLLETHDVAASLKDKLKALVFIPIISRTYCDPNSYAWEHEFKAFIEQAAQDRFGLKTKLPNGNVAGRVLPVRIHEIDPEDIRLAESYLGFIRPVDFIYKSAGVNRPLRASEDHPQDNLNKTYYRDQINKVANAIDEIIRSLKNAAVSPGDYNPPPVEPVAGIRRGEGRNILQGRVPEMSKTARWLIVLMSVFLFVVAAIAVVDIIGRSKQNRKLTVPEKTMAVLPFQNLGNDTSQLYFCDGFMNEILNSLEKIKSFTVRSGTSTNQYRDTKKTSQTIGRELKADYLIRGAIGFEGNTRKIWVQLIESRSDRQIWSDGFTREMEMAQIFSLQSEIAQTIASKLKAVLSPEEIKKIEKRPTEDVEAYNYYLKGNYYLNRSAAQNYKTANEFYELAIRYDPGFSLAYANYALSLLQQYWFYEDHTDELLNRCKKLIDKAFELDPDLPEAHLALGNYYYRGYLKYEEALEQFEIVLKEQQGNSEAVYSLAATHRRAGNLEKALSFFLKALELDPRSSNYAFSAGETLYLMRDYDKAEEYYNTAIMLQPDWETPYPFLSRLFIERDGDTRRARELLEKVLPEIRYLRSGSHPFISSFIQMDLYDGQYEKALQDLALLKADYFQSQFYFQPKYQSYATIYGLMNKPLLERAYYDSTRIYLEKKLLEMPDDSRIYSSLGIACAGLGLADKAIRAGKKAAELMPLSKEAWRGTHPLSNLALIYTMLGKYSEAIEELNFLLSVPGDLSVRILQLDPVWKPLWDLPEFKKLVKSFE